MKTNFVDLEMLVKFDDLYCDIKRGLIVATFPKLQNSVMNIISENKNIYELQNIIGPAPTNRSKVVINSDKEIFIYTCENIFKVTPDVFNNIAENFLTDDDLKNSAKNFDYTKVVLLEKMFKSKNFIDKNFKFLRDSESDFITDYVSLLTPSFIVFGPETIDTKNIFINFTFDNIYISNAILSVSVYGNFYRKISISFGDLTSFNDIDSSSITFDSLGYYNQGRYNIIPKKVQDYIIYRTYRSIGELMKDIHLNRGYGCLVPKASIQYDMLHTVLK